MKGKTILLLLAAGTLSLAGCQKSGLFNGGDSAIRFTASARPDTKTEYGAYVAGTGTSGWQSIDWVNGDKIRIYSDNAVRRVGYESGEAESNLYHWADYSVTGAAAGESQTKLSTATLVNLTNDGNGVGNGLIWGDAASANFYAIYPMPATTDGKGAGIDGAKGILAGSIPASQAPTSNGETDMSYAYLTAVGSGQKPNTDNVTNVSLTFYPAFTAFEFSLKSLKANTNITGANLASRATALSGDFTVTYTDEGAVYGCPDFASTNNTVGITFGTAQALPSGADAEPFTFTLFALPQDLTSLTLEFLLSTGETRTINLADKNGEYIEFDACKKHRIYGLEMPDGTWQLFLESEVADWELAAHTPVYGNANDDGVVINASALEFASGFYEEFDEDGNRTTPTRTNAILNSVAEPLVAYFGLFAPTGSNCKWRITMKGENPNKFTLNSPMDGVTTGTITIDETNYPYIEGPVFQRVYFALYANTAPEESGEGDDGGESGENNVAESGDSVELYFTVVVSTGSGENAVVKEYSLHSEVTRNTKPLTVTLR